MITKNLQVHTSPEFRRAFALSHTIGYFAGEELQRWECTERRLLLLYRDSEFVIQLQMNTDLIVFWVHGTYIARCPCDGTWWNSGMISLRASFAGPKLAKGLLREINFWRLRFCRLHEEQASRSSSCRLSPAERFSAGPPGAFIPRDAF